jgi:hypothetical protein
MSTQNINSEHNLSEVIYESVNSEYGWGKYGEFRVLIRKKDGYINATKLCALGGKELFNYMANASSQRFIDEVVCTLSIPRVQLVEVLKAGSNYELNGTYVHQDLVPHIASWVSPQFAIKVSKIVNNFIVREYREQIRVKDDKIDELVSEVLALKKLTEKQSIKIDRQSDDIQTLVAGSNRLEKNLGVANENIVSTLRTLGRVSDRAVPLDRVLPSKKESFTVLDFNDPRLSVPYCVIRAQEVSTRNTVAAKRKQYPNLRVVVQYADHPNARELWNAVKMRIRGQIVVFPNNTFCLENIGEDRFVEVVQSIDAEKRKEHKDMLVSITADADEEEEEIKEEYSDNETKEEEPSVVTAVSLLFLTLRDLKEMCRQHGWKGWSKLNKPELAEFIVTSSSS